MKAQIASLLQMLRTDDPPVEADVEAEVLRGLSSCEPSDVVAALTAALKDEDTEYRCTIASIFLEYDYASAIPFVGQLVHDEDDGVQGFICGELGAYGRSEAIPYLVEALTSDPDGTNRAWAAWGLGNIGDPAALPALSTAMQNDDGVDYEGRPVKKIAAEAIRRITHEKTAASVA